MAPALRWVGLVVYYACAVAVYALLLGRQSSEPLLFRYSGRYLVVLAFALLIFAGPQVYRFVRQELGWKKAAFAAIPASVLAMAAYLAGSIYYYHANTIRQYDPFLQMPPARFDVRAKAEGELRILAMGGSTTFTSTYPRTLAEELERQLPERSTTVLNAAVPWWTTKHSLINYATYGYRLDPDIVLVMHGINDVVRSCANEEFTIGPYKDDYSHFYGATIRTARLLTAERALFLGLFGSAYTIVNNRTVDHPVDWFRSLDPFEENLRRTVALVKRDGRQAVLLTQPTAYRDDQQDDVKRPDGFGFSFCSSWTGFLEREYPSSKAMAGAMREANERVRRVASEQDVLLVDLDKEVPKVQSNFVDEVHHTDEIGDRIGESVARALLDGGAIRE